MLILEDLATDRGAILLTKDLLIKSQIMSARDLRNFESRLAENAGKVRLDQNNRKMHQRKFDYIKALGEVVHREMIKTDTGSDDTNGDVIQFNRAELQKFIMEYRGKKLLTVLNDINKDNPERSRHKHPHKLSDYQTAIQLIEFIRTPKSPDDQKKASTGTRGNSKETEGFTPGPMAMAEGTPDKGKALERELHLVLHELRRKQTRMQLPESDPVPLPAVNAEKEPAQAPAKSKDIFDKLNIPGSLQNPEANMDLPRFVNQLQQTLSDTKQRRVLYFYHLAAEARMRVAQMEGYLVNTIRVNVYPRVALMFKENQYSPDKTSRQLTQEIAQKITSEVKKADVEVFCFKQYSTSQKPADEDYRFRRYLESRPNYATHLEEQEHQEMEFKRQDKEKIEKLVAEIPAELNGSYGRPRK